ncbi:DNA-binding protein [Streptomyces sp. ACA25]|uniref:DNA-binding protein n=1 Tax=Streptomyces sp. ACA25 TaxID=3022596 RepID=UPI0023073731|nr:DNA-binding protein [Streptomyces sp. ACA25]MDB1086123.1 DNA-binding protein [Streptomyces sp. ACA25]
MSDIQQAERTDAGELLTAGAVLPPGTEGAGERAVPLTARTYRHPGVADRLVVRLAAEELGAAEDLAAGFLGLEPSAEPAVVGLGLRQSLGFPEWVLVHHPEDGHHALDMVPELERVARLARSKPGAAWDAYLELGVRLAGAVPHFLPTFYEQAARVFLALDNLAYASRMFTRARLAETEHGLRVDEDRLEAVFLEFALAGALPVKALAGYAQELALRVPAPEALRRFRALCLRRTAGGLPPSSTMATALRKLLRAAGEDAAVGEEEYLAELLALPATRRAPAGWWKAHRGALVRLARREPPVRGQLLDLMPTSRDKELPGLWVEILEKSGAVAGLCDTTVPARECSADGAAGWLERFLTFRGTWGSRRPCAALPGLVERMADRLRGELTTSGGALPVPYDDVHLLDLLLALNLPVADPGNNSLALEEWARDDDRRDLVALEADPRFRAAFRSGADRIGRGQGGQRALRALAASPGGRPMLVEWLHEVARSSTVAGLPGLPRALDRLAWLPGDILELAAEEVRAAASADVAQVLVRTLRAGLFDELGWPAWEEAAASLVPENDITDLHVADAWPHLIVAGSRQARVIGAEGTALTHDLRTEYFERWMDPAFHYVDGELLVHWTQPHSDTVLRGYWHTSADRQLSVESRSGRTRGTEVHWLGDMGPVTLPLPGGGRATGAGVLHRGDNAVPAERNLISDGTSYWAWRENREGNTHGWYAYDPATGTYGPPSLPGFLSEATLRAPSGSTFRSGWLLPAPEPEARPAGRPVGGLLGWRVVRLPDGSHRGEDLAGHTVTAPPRAGMPLHALVFPGDARPRALVRNGFRVRLVDGDGVVTAEASTDGAPGAFARGTRVLPPVRYWHLLRPRDPQGSEALRRIDRDTAAALIDAVAGPGSAEGSGKKPDTEELSARVRSVLPAVRDDALAAGIAGVARFAAEQQAALDAVTERLDGARTGGAQGSPNDPTDQQLADALDGLVPAGWVPYDSGPDLIHQVRALGAAAAGSGPGPAGRLHTSGPALPVTRLNCARVVGAAPALMFRVAAAATEEPHRDHLCAVLRELNTLGLTGRGSDRWRTFRLHLESSLLSGTPHDSPCTWRGVLPLADGAFLACVDHEEPDSTGTEFTALFHDPAGRFEVPAPYTVRSSSPIGDAGAADGLGAYLTEYAERGPAPWFPAAAEEFARLTGVPEAVAALVMAGLPQGNSYERNFLSAEVRAMLGVKVAAAALARDDLRDLDARTRQAVVAALLPAEPALLWTEGPRAAAAAEVWNREVGRRAAVPEALLAEAARAVRTSWPAGRSLPALLDPAAEPRLSRDLEWHVDGDRVAPVERDAVGFTADTLIGAVTMCAWLAHRLPAGDPCRAGLPAALTALRERLAHPGLMLDLNQYVTLSDFRKVAGAPTETGEGWVRYGAVVLPTHDDQPSPGIRTALLDDTGQDPYLPALRPGGQQPFPAETALRTARDPRFAALLGDPGEPAAGTRNKEGTWWPQDPARSVPDLVTEVAKEYGLSEETAALYLMLLAMPDPTDRNTARWTGAKPARLKAMRAELAASDLVVQARRARAGRSLFLPGAWVDLGAPRLPLEEWKLSLLTPPGAEQPLDVLVPLEPPADLYRRAWTQVREGDSPRYQALTLRRGKRR